jgi:hypothetical protein
MIYPRCGQGSVLTVRILALDQAGYLCDECDALWFDASTIGAGGFVDYGTWMEAHGRPGLWSEIELLADETPPDARAGDAP